ncbi:MAG: hypothetical protein ABSB53_07925 [Nitrososphaerales archaeon]|jgi:hypothetical protein
MRTTTKSYMNHSGGLHRAAATVIAIVLLVGSGGLISGVASAASFNNVQIFVTTSVVHNYSYTVAAYNLTGSLVGTYESSYPAAAFELPTGSYLFIVSAMNQLVYACSLCEGSASTTTKSPNGTVISTPIEIYQPSAEYGFLVQYVDSALTLNIATQNVTQYPTSRVTIKVSYVNGTAVAGASISASIVGQWYYWWGQDSGVSMSNTTGSGGMATLVIPRAPAVITGWSWVKLDLPNNATKVQGNVSGEIVNATVPWVNATAPWELAYVGLSGATLLLPPATTANLTLNYQQPDYWVMPMGVQSAPSPVNAAVNGTVASKPTGVPAQSALGASKQSGGSQYYAPTSIPTIASQSVHSQPNQQSLFGLSTIELVASVGVAAAAALGILSLFIRRRTQKLSPP